jgi:hypothetical protein
MVEATTEKF